MRLPLPDEMTSTDSYRRSVSYQSPEQRYPDAPHPAASHDVETLPAGQVSPPHTRVFRMMLLQPAQDDMGGNHHLPLFDINAHGMRLIDIRLNVL